MILNRLGVFATVATGFVILVMGCSQDLQAEPDFLSKLSGVVGEAEKTGKNVVEGSDGWMFFVPELRAMSVGPFWGEAAVNVSKSSNPKYADPLPAIVDFHTQLKKEGIDLLIVPVPGKAAVYPEKLGGAAKRSDEHHVAFYKKLADEGVSVFDPYEILHQNRETKRGFSYCKTDSHWSSWGITVVAAEIAERYKKHPVMDAHRRLYKRDVVKAEITGDLALMLNEANPKKEKLSLGKVTQADGGLVEPQQASPILLMGDSHTLVFHDPGLHARSAGLPDQLAFQFGMEVDLVGVRGSGSTATRISLMRRKDNLAGKKLVIWCFSMREFTESTAGWRNVPVIRK